MDMATFKGILDSAHPTREEWERRQVAMPEDARRLLDLIEARKRAAKDEAAALAERQAKETAMWRQQFEAAMAGVLVANGAEWLLPYRVPDHECAALPEFTGKTSLFWALFDPRAVGLWPIAVRLQAVDGSAVRSWRPLAPAPWRVYRPSGDLSYREFMIALEFAAHYTTPF